MDGGISKKRARPERAAIMLCGLLSPVFGFLLWRWSWLIESLRIDDYGYGPALNTIVISAVLVFNALIIKFFYPTGTLAEQMSAWLKGTSFTFLSAAVLFGLGALLYVLAFSGGHWSFG